MGRQIRSSSITLRGDVVRELVGLVRSLLALVLAILAFFGAMLLGSHVVSSSPSLDSLILRLDLAEVVIRTLVFLAGSTLFIFLGYRISMLIAPEDEDDLIRFLFGMLTGWLVVMAVFIPFLWLGHQLFSSEPVFSLLGSIGRFIGVSVFAVVGLAAGVCAGFLVGFACFDKDFWKEDKEEKAVKPQPAKKPHQVKAARRQQAREEQQKAAKLRRQQEEKLERIKREADKARRRSQTIHRSATQVAADFDAAFREAKRQGVRFSARERSKIDEIRRFLREKLRRSHVERQRVNAEQLDEEMRKESKP